MAKKKPLKIDMIAGSQLRDTQGEMLSVEGADISELQAGRGRLNDNHGKGFFNSIGRITDAKKIFKKEDCENERQEYYWDKVKAPYIYVVGELYDDEDHPNARAASAILRNIHKADTPLQLKASVEGGVVARGISDSSLLARTKIHSVALTFTPANNNTLVEPLSLNKSEYNVDTDMELIKSVMHLAETNVPSFRHIARDASANKVQNNLLKLVDLMRDLGIEGDIKIPSKKTILEKALEQKILNNLSLIKDQVSALKQEELEKAGIGDSLKAAGLSTAIALSPANTKPKEPQNAPKITHQQMYEKVSKENPLLGAIGMVESSGGRNLNHRSIASDHGDTKAGGAYGIMPQTAAFILSKDKQLAQKYPKLYEASKDLANNHHVITQHLNDDPQADADFASAILNRNKSKTTNKAQLIYSWLYGLKGSWNKYKKHGKDAFKDNEYVKKVLSHLPNESKETVKKPLLNKALMAGYGGASAPTARVGGAVIQTESLDPIKSGFKYITCDNCGKEQIHSKHQIKCRECGHSMSFDKLAQVMVNNK